MLQDTVAANTVPLPWGVPGKAGGGGSPLTPWLTQSEVRHGLHLAEIAGAAVDDAQVGPAAPGEQHHFGPSGKGPEAGAGDDTQPVVAGTLRGRREQRD